MEIGTNYMEKIRITEQEWWESSKVGLHDFLLADGAPLESFSYINRPCRTDIEGIPGVVGPRITLIKDVNANDYIIINNPK